MALARIAYSILKVVGLTFGDGCPFLNTRTKMMDIVSFSLCIQIVRISEFVVALNEGEQSKANESQ